MKSSRSMLLGVLGLTALLAGCQTTGGTGPSAGGSASGTTASAGGSAPTSSPAGSLEACLAAIGDVSAGQRMLAEGTCRRNAAAQAAMDQNPGDYLPPSE